MKSAEMGYWDIIKIGKNTQETVSRQKTQQEKHKKIEKGLDNIIKTTKKGNKNWVNINTENYLKRKKINRGESIQEININTGVCLMKIDKNII